jgi:hypothetical protein
MIYSKEEIIGTTTLLHTYSDSFYLLQKETGLEYEEAWDAIPCKYTYEESNTPLHKPEEGKKEE